MGYGCFEPSFHHSVCPSSPLRFDIPSSPSCFCPDRQCSDLQIAPLSRVWRWEWTAPLGNGEVTRDVRVIELEVESGSACVSNARNIPFRLDCGLATALLLFQASLCHTLEF